MFLLTEKLHILSDPLASDIFFFYFKQHKFKQNHFPIPGEFTITLLLKIC